MADVINKLCFHNHGLGEQIINLNNIHLLTVNIIIE